MKRLSFAIAAAASLLLSACQKEKSFTFDCDFSSVKEMGMTVDSLALYVGGEVIASAKELQDSHAVLKGKIEEPAIGTLRVYVSMQGMTDSSDLEFIVEPGTITMDANGYFARGTELNDAVAELFTQLDSIVKTEGDCLPALTSFVEAHKADVSSALVLGDEATSELLDYEELSGLYEQLSDEVKATGKMQELKLKLDKLAVTSPGSMFTDFEAEYNGEMQHFSDYVGKGKYVIADFWASWCGPCRREIPYLINVYNTYKGDNFNVVGVATWDKPEDTQKAIEELGIPYPQIMNAQRAGSDAYGIDGIPEIILFAPDGKILKRGLRGDDIEAAVKECLGL